MNFLFIQRSQCKKVKETQQLFIIRGCHEETPSFFVDSIHHKVRGSPSYNLDYQGGTLIVGDMSGLLNWWLALIITLLLLFAVPWPGRANVNDFELTPKWVRPVEDGIISLRLGPEIEVNKKMFLRLIGATVVRELPLDSEQLRRRIVEVKIPNDTHKGTYKTELVNEEGKVLASGPNVKVAASEKPSITKIVPQAIYPSNDTYNFDVIGENFGADIEDIDIMINDIKVNFEKRLFDFKNDMTLKDCTKLPCLICNWKTLRIFGLSLKKHHFYRPIMLSVDVDGLVSDYKPLILSCVERSTPGVISFVFLGALIVIVYLFSRRKAAQYQVNGQKYTTLQYLFIDTETNSYSLSKFQLLLWTAAAIVAYVYLATSQFLVQWNWELPKVPEGLPTLLGVSAGTTALAMGAAAARGSKGAGPVHPELGDFITTGGLFAPERLQFFIWTLLGVIGFVSATLAQDPSTVTELPKVPDNFIPLMGVSSLGYLAGKIARKPGPVIKMLNPPPPYNSTSPITIRILGENLSPDAQVMLYGKLLPSDEVNPLPQQPKDVEFVKELVLTPKEVSSVPGAVAVKIINRDKQIAEYSSMTPTAG